MTSCVKADDRGHAGWQFAPCLSIVSKSLPRPERAGADVSAFDVRNLCPRAGPTAATAGGVATLSSEPINIPTIWLTSSTSPLLRRKMADKVPVGTIIYQLRNAGPSRTGVYGVRIDGDASDSSISFRNSIDGTTEVVRL